jgi:hypothetical protein
MWTISKKLGRFDDWKYTHSMEKQAFIPKNLYVPSV